MKKNRITSVLLITICTFVCSLMPTINAPAGDGVVLKRELKMCRVDTSDTGVEIYCKNYEKEDNGITDDLCIKYGNREFFQELNYHDDYYHFNLNDKLELGEVISVYYKQYMFEHNADFFAKIDEYANTSPDNVVQGVVQLEKPIIAKVKKGARTIKGTGYKKSTMTAFVGKKRVGKAVCNSKGEFKIKVKPALRGLLKKKAVVSVKSSYKLREKVYTSISEVKVAATVKKQDKTSKANPEAVTYPGMLKFKKVSVSSKKIKIISTVPSEICNKIDMSTIVLSTPNIEIGRLPITGAKEYVFDLKESNIKLDLGQKIYVWTDNAYRVSKYPYNARAVVDLINSKNEVLDFAFDSIKVTK